MRRIAAKYLYPLVSTEPVLNGFVELEDDGTVIRTGYARILPRSRSSTTALSPPDLSMRIAMSNCPT